MSNLSSENIVSSSRLDDFNWWDGLMGIFVVIGTFGNLIVLITIVKYKKLRTPQNLFIASLATGDLLVCGFVMSFGVYELVLYQRWYLGGIMCRIWTSIDLITIVGTIWSLSVLTLDRLLAIKQPLLYAAKQSASKAFAAIVLIWIFAVVLEVPMIVRYEVSDNKMHLCYIAVGREYRIFAAFFTFYVPLFIIVTTNFCILRVARARSRRNRVGVSQLTRSHATVSNELATLWQPVESTADSSHPSASRQTSTPCTRGLNTVHKTEDNPPTVFIISGQHHKIQRESTERRLVSRDRKSSFFVAAFCLSFVVCWLPFSTYLLCAAGNPSIGETIPTSIPVLLRWLGWLNSFVNCFFYGILKPDLRVHIHKIIKSLRFS